MNCFFLNTLLARNLNSNLIVIIKIVVTQEHQIILFDFEYLPIICGISFEI